MDKYQLLDLTIQALVAVATVAVTILAIWGEQIRDRLAGPKLTLTIADSKGDLTTRQNGERTIYYHLRVENRRKWALAKQVSVLCTRIAKRRPDGSFTPENLVVPVQLCWAFPQLKPITPDIRSEEICDFGFLDEGKRKFDLAVYLWPNNFQGFVSPGEAMRVTLILSAGNFTSTKPHTFEVSLDGQWSSDLEQMRKHLVFKETAGDGK